MPFRWNPREHLSLALHLLKWLLIGAPAGALVGCAVALFLWSLEQVTRLRWDHPWLLYFLPLAGVGIALMYQELGRGVEAGNNLIMDRIHQRGGGVPMRMAPLVLIGTVVTHLFGGSAGREGTAVQMGGSIAGALCRWLRLNHDDMRLLLSAGMAAGFGAVFGTPLTGAVFAIEVLAIGRMSYSAIIPCLIASIVADQTTMAFHIQHTQYRIASFATMSLVKGPPLFSWLIVGKVAVAAIAFGLASVLFAELTHGLQWIFKRAIKYPLIRPIVGGLLVIGLAFLIGPDYLGLGVNSDPNHPQQVCIVSCFQVGGAHQWSWWWKLLFTAVTLSSGFKGGEVTPLFFVGAALGNTLAGILHVPVDLLAAIGFVAVFSGATNTPLACTIMGIELFGRQPGLLESGFVVYVAVGCFVAYLLSGHSGIYLSQRIGSPKVKADDLEPESSLRSLRAD